MIHRLQYCTGRDKSIMLLRQKMPLFNAQIIINLILSLNLSLSPNPLLLTVPHPQEPRAFPHPSIHPSYPYPIPRQTRKRFHQPHPVLCSAKYLHIFDEILGITRNVTSEAPTGTVTKQKGTIPSNLIQELFEKLGIDLLTATCRYSYFPINFLTYLTHELCA